VESSFQRKRVKDAKNSTARYNLEKNAGQPIKEPEAEVLVAPQ
jgi:hypothetical protein